MVTYEFECSILMPDCDTTLEGETREDVLDEVADHMREHHGMIELPPEMTQRVLAAVRPED